MDTINYPLKIQQGADFAEHFDFYLGPNSTYPLADLTGVTGRAQVRSKAGGTLVIDLVVTIDAEKSGETVTKARVTVGLPKSVTTDLAFTKTQYWDLFLDWESGYTIKPFEGPVDLDLRVTE